MPANAFFVFGPDKDKACGLRTRTHTHNMIPFPSQLQFPPFSKLIWSFLCNFHPLQYTCETTIGENPPRQIVRDLLWKYIKLREMKSLYFSFWGVSYILIEVEQKISFPT